MKKVIACIIVILALCSCANVQDNSPITNEASVSEVLQSSASESQTEEPTESTSIIDLTLIDRLNYLVRENIRCVESIFYLDMMPTVGSSEILDEATVAQVNYPKFNTYKDFEIYIRDLFSYEYAEKKLKTDVYEGYPQYFEHNGALYENVSMLGSVGYFIDWDNFKIDNINQTGDDCKFDVAVLNNVEGNVHEPDWQPYIIKMEAVKENCVWKLVKMYTGE